MEVNICITLELNISIVFSARNRVARFDVEQVLLKDYMTSCPQENILVFSVIMASVINLHNNILPVWVFTML